MALSETGKKKVKQLAIAIGAIVLIGFVYAKWDTLGNTFSFLTKKVGNVQAIEQGDYAAEEKVNAEVLETVDYKLPFRQLPTGNRITVNRDVKKLKGAGIMWNGSAAALEGNGGKYTTKGSYFDELGRKNKTPFFLELGRQDNYADQQDGLVTFTREYLKSEGKVTDKGYAIVWYMGDNGEAYQTQLNNKLKALEKEFDLKEGSLKSEAFVIAGYSYGEDKFMGPAIWKEFPDSARGAVVACYPLDGDQNLVIKWAIDNGIPINPDGTTYCPDAINFAFTDGFMEAAEAVGTKTGERLLVSIDPKTGETRKSGGSVSVEIRGAGTWTPGDELAFNKAKSAGWDMVSIYSTYDNAHQMPCVLTTVNVFLEKNPGIIDAIVEGTTAAGDQMKTHVETFNHAMGVMAEVYEQKTADYWGKFFRGFEVETPNGIKVKLGGTRVCNLADNLDAFGVGEGARGTYQSSFELFGGFMHKLYPNDLPERLPYFKAVNTDPLSRVMDKLKSANQLTTSKKAEFETGAGKISETVAKRAYAIEFATGSAKLTKEGVAELEAMFRDLNTHDLLINLSGHTDNTGSDEQNIPLSKQRAEAVYTWLNAKNPASFPRKRFESIQGFGSKLPVADNATAAGRAQNRRVEIVVGH